MDVINALMTRRGYKVLLMLTILLLLLFLLLLLMLRLQGAANVDNITFYDHIQQMSGKAITWQQLPDAFISYQVQGSPQQRTLPNIHNKDDK